jgi:hypothetical protein
MVIRDYGTKNFILNGSNEREAALTQGAMLNVFGWTAVAQCYL